MEGERLWNICEYTLAAKQIVRICGSEAFFQFREMEADIRKTGFERRLLANQNRIIAFIAKAREVEREFPPEKSGRRPSGKQIYAKTIGQLPDKAKISISAFHEHFRGVKT
jgi:hypothetical protein